MTLRSKGFTIIELMIATAVFSTILLVVLTAVTQIGRMYYKGITTAQTQEAARTILDRVSQEIQFSGEASTPTYVFDAPTRSGAICVGKSRFFFVLNKVSATNSHAIWADTDNDSTPGVTGCSAAVVASVTSAARMNAPQPTPAANNGKELLDNGMRAVILSAPSTGVSTLWKVNVKVVFGADDLLEASDGSAVTSANYPSTTCKGSQIGTQFCAVSELSTTVLKRVP